MAPSVSSADTLRAGRRQSLLPALAKNVPLAHFLNASRPRFAKEPLGGLHTLYTPRLPLVFIFLPAANSLKPSHSQPDNISQHRQLQFGLQGDARMQPPAGPHRDGRERRQIPCSFLRREKGHTATANKQRNSQLTLLLRGLCPPTQKRAIKGI